MSRESKFFSVPDRKTMTEKVKELECFGWELLSVSGLNVTMTRETQNKVYPELVRYEYEYEALNEELNKLHEPISPFFNVFLFIILTILFILPGILYLIYYLYSKQKYMRLYNEYSSKYDQLSQQIKEICDKSRIIFFSPQEE